MNLENVAAQFEEKLAKVEKERDAAAIKLDMQKEAIESEDK